MYVCKGYSVSRLTFKMELFAKIFEKIVAC